MTKIPNAVHWAIGILVGTERKNRTGRRVVLDKKPNEYNENMYHDVLKLKSNLQRVSGTLVIGRR